MQENAHPQILTAWGRLYHLLKAALPQQLYRFGAALQGFEQDEDGVAALLSDGSRLRGDILVGADGIRSTLRQRSEERRVGKECVSTCRSRWPPYHEKNKKYLK